MKKCINTLINQVLSNFAVNSTLPYVVPNSLPILWFGDLDAYFNSELKIVTASLNPSDNEFKDTKNPIASTNLRFPNYTGTTQSLYDVLNNYFKINPYNAWFKASFGAVLKSFDASFYHNNETKNIAIHTDIMSPYSTNPTWSGLKPNEKNVLQSHGNILWHDTITCLEPDIILMSSSKGNQNLITFPKIKDWQEINVNAKTPLLVGEFEINGKPTCVYFQTQGRKPFLQTDQTNKLKFNQYKS